GVDQYEGWSRGEEAPAEEYLALLPQGEGRDQAACDIVYGEYLLLEQLGRPADLAAFQARFPSVATLLARQVELHRVLAQPEPDPEVRGQESASSVTPVSCLLPPERPAPPGSAVLDELPPRGP